MTPSSPDIESLIAAARERHIEITFLPLNRYQRAGLSEDGLIHRCKFCSLLWPCPDRLLLDALTGVIEAIDSAEQESLAAVRAAVADTETRIAVFTALHPLSEAIREARSALGEPNA